MRRQFPLMFGKQIERERKIEAIEVEIVHIAEEWRVSSSESPLWEIGFEIVNLERLGKAKRQDFETLGETRGLGVRTPAKLATQEECVPIQLAELFPHRETLPNGKDVKILAVGMRP